MNSSRKVSILLVDEDAGSREALSNRFALHEEFAVTPASTGAAALLEAKGGLFDLVLMDVTLSDMDGHEAVRLLRKNGFRAPVILLSGRASDADTILGLESGANDYMTKPFRFPVLLARIRAHLRQHQTSEDAMFRIGPYSFRPSSKLLVNQNGRKVRLTAKETDVLLHLHRAGPYPVPREQLLHEVWGHNSGVNAHTLETHIYHLRQKVERDAAMPLFLVTEGRGYRLAA